MTDERRYGEDEVAAIFEAASTPRTSRRGAPATAEGMTLAELQSIGQEVGVPPDRIAEAALALDRPAGVAPRRSFLGMPIGVGRVVDLPRAPNDREWEVLVAELRRTFNAKGKVVTGETVREWWNGNLHAIVEPTETGVQLRLGTTKGDAAAVNYMGIGLFAVAAVLFVALVGTGELDAGWFASVIPSLMGAAAIGFNAVRLPQWAQLREKQIRHIEARALALIGRPVEPEPRQTAE